MLNKKTYQTGFLFGQNFDLTKTESIGGYNGIVIDRIT